jgi:hypothetical protein
MRTAKETDFNVEVEGFGTFVFGRRTREDHFKIRSRYNVLTEGLYDEKGNCSDISALGYVVLQTMLVSCPETFNFEALDPLMDDDFDKKIMKVFTALSAKEQSFRPQPAQGS